MKGKNISFDYDLTLDDGFYGEINIKKEQVRNKLLELKEDNNIFIITKRYGPKSKYSFLKEYEKVYELGEKLGVDRDNIFFCNRELKIENLRKRKIDIHFDDDLYELDIYSKICDVININKL
jgi:uncharacterized HAD superfamily protein